MASFKAEIAGNTISVNSNEMVDRISTVFSDLKDIGSSAANRVANIVRSQPNRFDFDPTAEFPIAASDDSATAYLKQHATAWKSQAIQWRSHCAELERKLNVAERQ